MPMNITDQPIGARNAWLKSQACESALNLRTEALAGDRQITLAYAQKNYYRLRDNFFRQYAEGKRAQE